MAKREYTEAQIAEAIALYLQNGSNAKKTLRDLGERWGTRPGYKSLERWCLRMDGVEGVAVRTGKGGAAGLGVLEQKKRLFLKRWGEILLLALDSLQKKLDDMHPKDLSRLAGIATDKIVILREGKRSSDAYGRAPAAAASASAVAILNVGADLVAEARKELIEGEVTSTFDAPPDEAEADDG